MIPTITVFMVLSEMVHQGSGGPNCRALAVFTWIMQPFAHND